MDNRFKGKGVLVTGSARGIGAAIAIAFAKEGYSNIGINYSKDRESAEKTAAVIEDLGANAEIIQADVSNKEDALRLGETFLKRFSTIDVLVNNAGGALKMPEGGFVDMPLPYWDSQINLNLNAAAYCSHWACKNMVENGIEGSIVNISSVHSIVTWVRRKMLPYCAAKAGMNMFTKALAIEMIKHNIHINCIAPGFIRTSISNRYDEDATRAWLRKIPLGSFGQVSDIAPLALFLADKEKSRFIVGQTIVVDGGQTIDGAMDSIQDI